MDTTLDNSVCRCCCKTDETLVSLFEFDSEMALDKMLMLMAPISITRNDGFPQKICTVCKEQIMNFWNFRNMCVSSDESFRSNRKPLTRNNEHDYSTWNLDYDIDLSEYLQEETIGSSFLVEDEIPQTPAVDETQNFDAPSPLKRSRRYSCPVCNKLWITPSKLKRHMSVHRNEKLLNEQKKDPEVQCPICFSAIESPSEFHTHMTTHIKIDPVSAPPVISQKTVQPNHMKPNITRVTTRSTNDSRQFMNSVRQKKAKLRNRSRKHLCPHCEKRFETPSKLIRHQTVHRDALKSLNPSIQEISAVTSLLGD